MVTRRRLVRPRAVDDEGLIARLRAGELAAFDELYARYHGRVYRYLVRMVLDVAEAEELHQETWTRFARGVGQLRDETKVAGWLFRIAHNLATSRGRRRAVEQRATAAWQDTHAPEPVRTPDELLAAARAREVLERALAALAPDDRELLLWVAIEGLRPQDAAEVLGVRPEALRKRLERARVRLRALIDRASAAQAPGGGER